jgi:hypothetical protein
MDETRYGQGPPNCQPDCLGEGEVMRIKVLVVCLAVVVFSAYFSGAASAANWKYVGKLDFASGTSWTAYVDTASVYTNNKARTVIYWVLFECKGQNVSFKKLVKYETKRDYTESTRSLEFHAYYTDNSVMTEANTPGEWKSVDEETLLRGALDIVYDVLAGKG